ncbi:MAG: transglutaminase domain-containing protein [Bacteroidales bacterium]|nr:transglutaminase domain-containing protein [Bacteroidales bacterium]
MLISGIKRSVILLIALASLSNSCTYVPIEVRKVLKRASSNRAELQAVINHYQSPCDSLKLKAAFFLISNMEDKYSVSSDILDEYYKILTEVNTLKRNSISNDSLNKIVISKIDSINRFKGGINYANLKIEQDLFTVTSEFLISNIDHAFMVWEKPWARHVNFKDFCEFILPYRIHNEPLSDWREHFYNELISFQDSVKDKSNPKELVLKISDFLYKKWNHFNSYSGKGFYPDLIEMEKCNGGDCNYRYFLFTGMCRSIGLPVAIESTPQWTTSTKGHAWNVVLDIDNSLRPFNGGEDNRRFYDKNFVPLGDGSLVCTKVYRQTFAQQKTSLPFFAKIDNSTPEIFRSTDLLDVTENYGFNKTECIIKIDKKYNNKVIYLFAFDYGESLKAVAWSKVKNNSANFGFVGLPAFYIPAVYIDNTVRFVHNPLVLPVDEKHRHEYAPKLDVTGKVKLYRKYYLTGEFVEYAKGMLGGIFEGSNKPDFSDAEVLYSVDKIAKGFEEVKIESLNKYRYFRYLSNELNDVRVAEIEFWGIDDDSEEKKLLGEILGFTPKVDYLNDTKFANAFDDNIRTNFNANRGSWVGIDLGQNRKARITRIWFLPRNNYNEIEKGHNYELLYLADGWKSLGTQVADKHYIEYDDVPKDALLLLKDLTEGREERVFMYDFDHNEQWWW